MVVVRLQDVSMQKFNVKPVEKKQQHKLRTSSKKLGFKTKFGKLCKQVFLKQTFFNQNFQVETETQTEVIFHEIDTQTEIQLEDQSTQVCNYSSI